MRFSHIDNRTSIVFFIIGFFVAAIFFGYFTLQKTLAVTSTPETTDNPPVISAFVKSASELHPTAIYAGLRAYVSVTITDDKGIASGGFTAPGMRLSSPEVSIYGCRDGVLSCKEPVYVLVPDKAGEHTVTVKATDTAGQVSTQVITFTAQGCVTDSECGGRYFPNSGATFCGPYDADIYDKIMKYQVVAVCTAGTCNEKTEPGVLESCGDGKVCTTDNTAVCVAKPPLCTIGGAITSICICGKQAYYPGYWSRYCCVDGGGYTNPSRDTCQVYTPPAPAPVPIVSPTSTPTSTPSSAPAAAIPAPPVANPAPASTSTPSFAPVIAQPLPVQQTPTFVTGTPLATPTSSVFAAPTPLSLRELREFERSKKRMASDLRAVEQRAMRLKMSGEFFEDVRGIREALATFKAIDTSAYSFVKQIEEEMLLLQKETDTLAKEQQALLAIKKWMQELPRAVKRIEEKVSAVRKKGFAIDATFTDTIAQVKTLSAQAKRAQDTGEIREVYEQLAERVEFLNDSMSHLEQLFRLPEALRILNQQFAAAQRLLKTARATAKRLPFDNTDVLKNMESAMIAMRRAIDDVKDGVVDGGDIAGYVRESVTEKFDEIRKLASLVQATANVQEFVRQTNATLGQFEKTISKRDKNDEPTEELVILRDDISEHVAQLKPFSGKRLTEETADEVLSHVQSIVDARESFAEVALTPVREALQQQLQKLFTSSPSVPPITLPIALP